MLHIPFDPISWRRLEAVAASRKQDKEALGYLAVIKELETAPAQPASEAEEFRSIDANCWFTRPLNDG